MKLTLIFFAAILMAYSVSPLTPENEKEERMKQMPSRPRAGMELHACSIYNYINYRQELINRLACSGHVFA